MYRFLCRRFGVDVRVSPSHELHFLQIQSSLSSFRYVSTDAGSANQESFAVSYLVNSCGLSPKSALSAAKHVNFENMDNPNSVLSFLKSQGFSPRQISELVRKDPKLLQTNPYVTLLPKLQFFLSKGFSIPDIVMMSSSKSILSSKSLTAHIVPSFNWWRDFLQSDKETVDSWKRCIFIPCSMRDFESRIGILRELGVPELNIVKLVKSWPGILCMSMDSIRRTLEKIREMNISLSDARLVEVIRSVAGLSKSTWQRKVDAFKKWNWSEEEILSAFKKQPSVMRVSEGKIMTAMDIFVNKLGWESKYVARNPFLISLSIEKRISPRACVLHHLLSKGLVSDSKVTRFFALPEEKFLDKFVHSYNDEGPEILKLYREKMGEVSALNLAPL